MRLRKFLVGAGVVALVALFAGTAMAGVVLKLGHYAAESHPGHKATLMFAEAVNKRTNGEVTIKIYPDNALGSPPEVLEQNKMGSIDMSLPTQGALDKYVRAFSVVMLPFVYDGYEHCLAGARRALHGMDRSFAGKGKPRFSVQLGMGLPQRDEQPSGLL